MSSSHPNVQPNSAPNRSTLPPLAKYIDLDKWEHSNNTRYQWHGYLPLEQLPRLWALRDTEATQANPELELDILIEQRGSLLFWQMTTKGTLWQTCQRCLEPLAVPLDSEQQLVLLKDESQAGLVSEDTETMLLEELTDGNRLWLLPMIEDELLVDLPLSPKHDDCDLLVTQVGELPEVEEQKPNPFAMLAALKQ